MSEQATSSSIRPASEPELNRLLASLLGEQQHLATPVVRASAAYDSRVNHSAFCPTAEPTQESALRIPHSAIHRDLIPLTAPGPGEQYAFEVDLDACSGCKACVSACHSLNGLDENESWRDVGLILSEDTSSPWQQTVTTACHHCAEPACLNGCPVAAYEKDPLTGIVRHLDDQCIGCSYCVLKCPYDVPKFNARLGIVRKCDMCHQRLAVDEAPACVQACPTSAIRIVNVTLDPEPISSESFRPVGNDSLPRSPFRPVGRVLPPPSDKLAGVKPAPPSIPNPTPDRAAVGPQLAEAGTAPRTPNRREQARALHPSACGCGGSCGCKTKVSSSPHRADTTHFLPAAPDPEYTQPTTRYVSARGIPSHIRAADASALRVQPAHWPLAAMLTLTQLAVGLLATAPLIALPFALLPVAPDGPTTPLSEFVTYYVTNFLGQSLSELVTYYVTFPAAHAAQFGGLVLLIAGLGSSTLHLGKPLRAWRFFLGLRTSWLSREILVFSAFAPLALASLLLPASLPLRLAIVATGLLGIACSAMIYIDTRRRFWAAAPTCIRFFGTALVAALATIHPTAAALVLLAKLGCEAAQARGSSVPARLQRGPLRPLCAARLLLGVTAAALLAIGPFWPALALFAAGELAERLLFFRAVDAPKMPGHPAP